MKNCGLTLILMAFLFSGLVSGCSDSPKRDSDSTGGTPPASSMHRDTREQISKDALKLDTAGLGDLIQSGNIFFDSGRYKDAIEAYEKCPNLNPKKDIKGLFIGMMSES